MVKGGKLCNPQSFCVLNFLSTAGIVAPEAESEAKTIGGEDSSGEETGGFTSYDEKNVSDQEDRLLRI